MGPKKRSGPGATDAEKKKKKPQRLNVKGGEGEGLEEPKISGGLWKRVEGRVYQSSNTIRNFTGSKTGIVGGGGNR